MLQRPRRTRVLAALVLALATSGGFLACGSRTALLGGDEGATSATGDDDANGGEGGRRDGARKDAEDTDALPPIDAGPKPDVDRTDCPDADATLIYVVTSSNELLSFYPPTATFRTIGNLACPGPGNPFSMAVDRKGIAYVLYTVNARDPSGIFRVSTATGACVATSFVTGQSGFQTFGMGFASNTIGASETLYVASDERTTGASGRLGSIDVSSFKLTPVGTFQPSLTGAELTGTGAGNLFAFYPANDGSNGSVIGQIDKSTAQVVAADPLPTVDQGNGWAFAFWGGDFWLFTSPGGSGSRVTRYRPSDKTTSVITSFSGEIVGAGVSTCAPQ